MLSSAEWFSALTERLASLAGWFLGSLKQFFALTKQFSALTEQLAPLTGWFLSSSKRFFALTKQFSAGEEDCIPEEYHEIKEERCETHRDPLPVRLSNFSTSEPLKSGCFGQ